MKDKKVISVSEEELRTMVKEAVRKKVAVLKEAEDLTARREVVLAAEKAGMDFEKMIIKILDLVHPDRLPTEYQKRYLSIVQEMNDDIVASVMNAAKQLTKFPKNKK
jgi:chemotaxis protein CheY-P-specific phosphatase CheC